MTGAVRLGRGGGARGRRGPAAAGPGTAGTGPGRGGGDQTDLFAGESGGLAAGDDDVRVVNVHPLLDAQGAGPRLGVLSTAAGVLPLHHRLQLLLLGGTGEGCQNSTDGG